MKLAVGARESRGFTLIELMIVVAIIGVLATLAFFAIGNLMGRSKMAEATNTIGAINRSAVLAFQRGQSFGPQIQTGNENAKANFMCDSSTVVPAGNPPKDMKYTARPLPNTDYLTGDQYTGWNCLKFEMSEPQYFQYAYTHGSTPQIATDAIAQVTGGLTADSWLAEARGDLNGDGAKFSNALGGGDTSTGAALTMTSIAITNETE